MNPDLERLVRLQRAESALRRVESEMAEIPRQKVELEAQLARERDLLEAAKAGLASSQKEQRQLEAQIQDLKVKGSKYKGQLMEVKTNKEYTAVLHEIEGVEREIRAREDQVLGEMERAETLAAEIKREEEAFKAAQERHRTEGRALDERSRTLESDTINLTKERDAVAATVGEDALTLFHRVARLRGVAVAEARDGMCQICHLKLRLQMYADLKKNEEIAQCPACNRILYYDPPPPVVSPQP